VNILALIPARGQSKRLPGKNIRPLGGRPLIAWSIACAHDAGIGDVIVSTDDDAIAGAARQHGATVPWLRPAALATDTARSADVALHALDWYETQRGAADALLLLQPTSPFRTPATVRQAIALFERHGRRPVVGVSPVSEHPAWTLTVTDGRLTPFLPAHGLDTRSQDLPSCFVVNGSIYLISPADLRASQSFAAAGATPLVIESPRERLDIDTPWDWQLAEWLAERPVLSFSSEA
jgi:CMP-N-acetylneuraminic acid synthetase